MLFWTLYVCYIEYSSFGDAGRLVKLYAQDFGHLLENRGTSYGAGRALS